MELTAKELEKRFSIKELARYNIEIRSKYNNVNFLYNNLLKDFEVRVSKEVKSRTKELKQDYEAKLEDKDKQIEALKRELAKKQAIIDNDSTNSGLPTSKTPIGKRKHIPNTRVKSDKKKGGQEGHKKHKLEKFPEKEATEIVEIDPVECNKCHSKNIEKLENSVDKEELDYDVILVKRVNKFNNYKCNDCGNVFHANIPNDLKEDIQYGKTVQSLAICLTNEIYTPFNKTVKLISGITKGGINMSESFVVKLQKRAAKNLEKFIDDLKAYFPKQNVFGWDDGVVQVNNKNGILRVYCTDNVVLLIGHENKNADGLEEDGILTNASNKVIVMHDHVIHNYNDKYFFDNVECMIHLIRRLKKMFENTHHDWNNDLISLLSNTNTDRNNIIENKNIPDTFSKAYLEKLDKKYDEIITKAKKQNEDSIEVNYFKNEEKSFIKDLEKYKRNYLLWAYNFSLPSTNNNSERNIRPVKSKMKISGMFSNVNYLKYYATIRSYIETCKQNGINIIEACIRLTNGNPYSLDEILNIGEQKAKTKE